MVIAAEEGEEVLREIALVGLGERAHDAEIERDVLAEVGRVGSHEDVAGMHVGVEKTVAEHLCEKNLHSRTAQARNVDAFGLEPLDLPDRDAAHALHHHDLSVAPVPIHFGNEKEWRMQEVAPELRAVGRFAAEIELIVDCLVELRDDLARFEALAVRPELLDQPGAHLHEREIPLDGRRDVRAQYLDCRRRAVGKLGEMHLRHRRARDRLALE